MKNSQTAGTVTEDQLHLGTGIVELGDRLWLRQILAFTLTSFLICIYLFIYFCRVYYIHIYQNQLMWKVIPPDVKYVDCIIRGENTGGSPWYKNPRVIQHDMPLPPCPFRAPKLHYYQHTSHWQSQTGLRLKTKQNIRVWSEGAPSDLHTDWEKFQDSCLSGWLPQYQWRLKQLPTQPNVLRLYPSLIAESVSNTAQRMPLSVAICVSVDEYPSPPS